MSRPYPNKNKGAEKKAGRKEGREKRVREKSADAEETRTMYQQTKHKKIGILRLQDSSIISAMETNTAFNT